MIHRKYCAIIGITCFIVCVLIVGITHAETIGNATSWQHSSGCTLSESSASCVRMCIDESNVKHLSRHDNDGTFTITRGAIIEIPLETLSPEIEGEEPLVLAEKIVAVRASLSGMVLASELTEEEITMILAIYEPWEADHAYVIDNLFRYDNELYKVNQAHTSQSDWVPGVGTDALYSNAAPAGVIPEWVQPQGAHDAYQIGDQVQFNGNIYASLISANVWSPAVYGWQLVD